jgi:hypothetical protein
VQRFRTSELVEGDVDRTWGKGVDGMHAGTEFEVCTAAANCVAGTGGPKGGEMQGPYGIAVDAAGYVYVSDSGNHRIQKFGVGGSWDRAWGKNVNGGGGFGVCTAAASCLAGSPGTLGGELFAPIDVAVDTVGNLYVADDGTSHRVQKFSTTGVWERAWGKNVNGGGVFGICTIAASCQAGASGGLAGEMNIPYGVVTDAASNLYVSELIGHRIDKFVTAPAIAPAGPTGQRAAALKKCKKKKGKARKKCKKKANKLPV